VHAAYRSSGSSVAVKSLVLLLQALRTALAESVIDGKGTMRSITVLAAFRSRTPALQMFRAEPDDRRHSWSLRASVLLPAGGHCGSTAAMLSWPVCRVRHRGLYDRHPGVAVRICRMRSSARAPMPVD
jgi:hypothetical protein